MISKKKSLGKKEDTIFYTSALKGLNSARSPQWKNITHLTSRIWKQLFGYSIKLCARVKEKVMYINIAFFLLWLLKFLVTAKVP